MKKIKTKSHFSYIFRFVRRQRGYSAARPQWAIWTIRIAFNTQYHSTKFVKWETMHNIKKTRTIKQSPISLFCCFLSLSLCGFMLRASCTLHAPFDPSLFFSLSLHAGAFSTRWDNGNHRGRLGSRSREWIHAWDKEHADWFKVVSSLLQKRRNDRKTWE